MEVYFIEAIGEKRVKIGCSTNPAERLSDLQTGNHSDLQLLFTVPGGRAIERRYHKKYAHLRVRENGEWFYFDGDLKQLIDAAMMYDVNCSEETDGLPVLRGIITNLTERWWENSDGVSESPQAYLQIWCPECGRHHRHGWDLVNGYDVIQHRHAHCAARSDYKERGYYIGVVKQPGVHCHQPGTPVTRRIAFRRKTNRSTLVLLSD